MTAATDEAWIENSLARLETLEAQRQQLAASGQTAALAEVDEEIRALYEVLESVAGGDEEGQAQQAPANMGMPAAPMGMAPPMQAPPMGMAPPMQAPPMGMAPPMQAPPMGMAPMGMAPDMGVPTMVEPSPSLGLDDIKPPRGPLPIILVGLLVVGGGAGAFFMMNKGGSEEVKAAPTEPAKIIQAGDIAEDTQEPNVAKGADVDRTRGTNFKESPAEPSRPRSSGGGGGGGSSSPRPKSSKKDDGRKIKVVDSNDPLAGID
ncbi:hypothetical protein [Paraliomyxa miuraensis]|uniref:hypothetical protein n=1 Tax=Paraliomyxa miuraensis TaxID=376150 RepID=UPI00225522FA|nr:hypothetical protein [Paraliomyxa miuraensis]MCX4239291.1 hypothetical protein [Paraliomyxa miuraensis]